MSRSLRDSAERHIKKTLQIMQKNRPYEALKELKKAEKDAQKAKADHILFNILNLKGQLMLTLREFEEAVKVYEQASDVFADLFTKYPYNEFSQSSLLIHLNNICTLGCIFTDIGRFSQAKNCYGLNLSILQNILEKDPENLAYQLSIEMTFNNLGALLSNIGRIEEAKEMYEKALKTSEILLKKDPQNISYQSSMSKTLNNLGVLLKNMGRFEEAKKRFEKSLKIAEDILKKDPRNPAYQSDVAMTLNNLATLYYKMGRIEESKQRYERSLEIRENLLKNDLQNVSYQSDVAMAFNNLGTLLYDMGCKDEAKIRFEKSLEIYEKLLKIDSQNLSYQSHTAMTLHNLGSLLSVTEHIEEAKERFEKSLEIYENLLKTDPENVSYQSDVAMTLNNLGILIYNMGYTEEAKQRFEKSLEMRENLLKTDLENVSYQSNVAMTLNNLGNFFSGRKHIEEAKERYENAFKIYEPLLKTDPKNIAYQSYIGTILNNLGALLKKIGCVEEAKQKYEKALEIFTEPMQYPTIGRKSNSIIKLIELNTEKAGEENDYFNQMKCLRETFRLCKEYQEFFIKYELKHERKLVTEAGLNAYIDFLIKNIKFESDSKKKAEKYEKALQAVEKLDEIENDISVSNLYFSAVCYLKGRKLVNEALASRKPELELLKQAVGQFRNARETYDKADVCFCIYLGLLKIHEKVENFEEVNVPRLKELVKEVVKNLPEDVNSSIKASFENIPQIFEENDTVARKELLMKLDEEIGNIEYKALEKLFGHVNDKIRDYFEEPFSPNVIYENWKLKVVFDDARKIKGRLTIKTDNKILLNRILTQEEIKNNLLEIDYLGERYIPTSKEEISFTTPEQKKPVIRQIDYFETINRDKRTRVFIQDFSDKIRISRNLRIAAVQLKYHAYEENSIVKITADAAYERKVMAILEAVKRETDVVVFPEFSIPFDYLGKIQGYANENGIVVIAGSHYVSSKNLGEYGRLFSREFREDDLRKNISPIIIPSLKITHNEKFLGAREERPAFFDKGMEIGKINNIFKLRERLNVGVMICYEFLNAELRHRLLPVCDIILVPQTNPKPQSFYKEAENEINRPLGGGTKAFVMANGIFTIGDDKKVTGGSTGVYLTLDKYSNEKKNQGIISPVDDVMEQFVLMVSINTDFYPAWDTQTGQEPIVLKLIHIFERTEIAEKLKERENEFIELIEGINNCNESNELRSLLVRERGSIDKKENEFETSLIKKFSPLMNKNIQNLDELKLEELKEKCRCLIIPNA